MNKCFKIIKRTFLSEYFGIKHLQDSQTTKDKLLKANANSIIGSDINEESESMTSKSSDSEEVKIAVDKTKIERKRGYIIQDSDSEGVEIIQPKSVFSKCIEISNIIRNKLCLYFRSNSICWWNSMSKRTLHWE